MSGINCFLYLPLTTLKMLLQVSGNVEQIPTMKHLCVFHSRAVKKVYKTNSFLWLFFFCCCFSCFFFFPDLFFMSLLNRAPQTRPVRLDRCVIRSILGRSARAIGLYFGIWDRWKTERLDKRLFYTVSLQLLKGEPLSLSLQVSTPVLPERS